MYNWAMEMSQLANSAALILTPRSALAQHLKSLHPQVNSYSCQQWLHTCWHQLADKPTLLTACQEQQIWRNVIESALQGQPLLNLSALAKLAQQAWRLQRKWQLPALLENAYFTAEVTQFSEWASAFRRCCETHKVASNTEIIPLLSRARAQFKWPAKIILLNFDKVNPQLKQFLAKLPSHVTVTVVETPAAVLKRMAFADAATELHAMAQWAKQQSQVNPPQQIQCVLPNLTARHAEVRRAFKTAGITCFTMGSARPLKQVAMINTALQLLNLNTVHNTINQFTALLLSRFICGTDVEMHSRARLDVYLRNIDVPLLRWQTVFTAAATVKNPLLVACLRDYLQQREQLAAQLASLVVWRKTFERLLISFGWPGDAVLNNEEIQQLQSWQALLDDFASLPLQATRISYQAAIEALEQLAQDNTFKELTSDIAVSVLDLREAATSCCDLRWVAGLHAQIWPGAVQLNPLLPYHWQTAYQLPHSNAEHVLAFAKRTTARLSSSAKLVIFSYPLHHQDQPVNGSLLLNDFLLESPAATNHGVMRQVSAKPLEKILDVAPRLQEHEKLSLRGGSALLRAQAACPFQAFARYRLMAKPLAEPTFNLTANKRGQLLHQALAIIWQQVQNQAALIAMAPEPLEQLIQHSVRLAMQQHTLLLQKFLPAWRCLEENCLTRLLVAWLTEEKKRPPFTVLAQEKSQSHELGGLKLNFIMDRIDKLADNSEVVIDYKTGKQNLSISHWFGTRPKDPQLPLYCLAYPQLRGSIIAQVRARGAKFIGLTATAVGISGVVEADWHSLTDAWETVLTQLAQQFTAGDAAVNPRDTEVCHYCDLHSLCRVHELPESTL